MMFGLIITYLRANKIIDDDMTAMLSLLAFVELLFELTIIAGVVVL